MSLLHRRQCISLAGGLALPLGCAWASVPELLMVTAAEEPYVLPPNHPLGEGLDVDSAREALMRGGQYRLQVEQLPWRRVLAMLKAGRADFSPGVLQTEERREYLAFSEPFGGPVRHSVYTRRRSGLSIRQLADLKGKRLALMAGAAFPEALQAVMTGPLERVSDLRGQFRMLAAGRVEALVGNELPARWLVRAQGYGDRVEQQPFTFDSGVPTQMAFSRRRPGFEQALAAMNRGLALLARTNHWAKLEARYLAG
ncbi:MAG: substrate-binding periplasmic protein [Inhella sp.]|uniref:substrate-binding periplasmic protein n=1 Tax=Inhella sp. TaxID=1921806 RepID=UPI003918AFA1